MQHTHNRPTTGRTSTHTSLFSHHEDTLPGHPAYWQHGSALDPVVVAGIQVPAHAKVGYLDVALTALVLFALTPLAAHQTVASSQVPVHEVEGGEEFHS